MYSPSRRCCASEVQGGTAAVTDAAEYSTRTHAHTECFKVISELHRTCSPLEILRGELSEGIQTFHLEGFGFCDSVIMRTMGVFHKFGYFILVHARLRRTRSPGPSRTVATVVRLRGRGLSAPAGMYGAARYASLPPHPTPPANNCRHATVISLRYPRQWVGRTALAVLC